MAQACSHILKSASCREAHAWSQHAKFLQEVKFLKQKIEIMETSMADMQQNADTAIAKAKPPPVDDKLAKEASSLAEQLRASERTVQEANKRVAALQSTLERKEEARKASVSEVQAAEEKLATVAKQLQGQAPVLERTRCFEHIVLGKSERKTCRSRTQWASSGTCLCC